ncbi:MAG: hypothetical protein M3N45_10775 [Actinomycetota bacterium]|nr:hypothetical protein [Actinomycetota bacterium]
MPVVGSEEDETLTGYTIDNSKKVEDQAPKLGHSPELESRLARAPSGTHLRQEEAYVLVGVSARMKIDDEVMKLEQVRRGSRREGAWYIVFGASNTENRDAEPASPNLWTDRLTVRFGFGYRSS